MRDPKRIDEFCDELKEVWKEVPDWRFFQLISNFQYYSGHDCFYMEEDKAIEKLREYISKVWQDL